MPVSRWPPRTLSGKKMELPVKKLLLGAAPAQVMNPDAMANADCIAWYNSRMGLNMLLPIAYFDRLGVPRFS
jgi:hypothetical protein